MKTHIHRLICFVGAAAVTFLYTINCFAGQTDWTGASSSDWNDASNWSNGVPNASNFARFYNGGTATLTSTASGTPTDVAMGYPTGANGGDPRGIVDIQTGGSLTLSGGDLDVGVRPAPSTSIFTVTGGSLTLATSSTNLIIGDDTASKGAVGISSGTISVGGNLRIGVHGDATFVVQGSTPVINVAGNLAFKEFSSSYAIFNVQIDAAGVAPINVTGDTILDNSPILGVSLNALAPTSDLVLINSTSPTSVIHHTIGVDGTPFYLLPQGQAVSAVFGLSTYNWTIDYEYGTDNNDIALVFQSVVTEPALLTGDVNGDHIVNQLDLNVVFGNWLSTEAALAQGDANGDGVINQLDINTITGNWLATGTGGGGLSASTVPEPGSFILLGLGIAGLGRNRRRRA